MDPSRCRMLRRKDSVPPVAVAPAASRALARALASLPRRGAGLEVGWMLRNADAPGTKAGTSGGGGGMEDASAGARVDADTVPVVTAPVVHGAEVVVATGSGVGWGCPVAAPLPPAVARTGVAEDTPGCAGGM